MTTQTLPFKNIVEVIYNLPIDERLELKNLLEHNISDSRREEIFNNYKASKYAHSLEKLKFTSDIQELKKILLLKKFCIY